MKLGEMRRAHEAATAGEWTHEGGYVRCGKFFLADVTLAVDAGAVVMAHNQFAKLLAVAEAAKMLLAAIDSRGENTALRALNAAVAALEES